MVAIICECNPFHNGHQYLFETAKRLTGEPVLAIMSGSFTQRGEVAVCSKFERAKIALEHGADLVVELPTVCAVARAQRFAQGGVSIADAFGAHYLAFGCECDDLSALRQAAFALSRADVNGEIARLMKNGAYYPQAVERAVRAVCGDRAADVLTAPNNILAAEYIRALVGSDIKPLPVRRVGVAHDSEIPSGGYCSASRLRALLRAGERVSDYLPEAPRELTDPALTERAILFRLRSMTAGDFRKLPEVQALHPCPPAPHPLLRRAGHHRVAAGALLFLCTRPRLHPGGRRTVEKLCLRDGHLTRKNTASRGR